MKKTTGFVCLMLLLVACGNNRSTADQDIQQEMVVTATAYNSLRAQTLGHPAEAAWGDTLKPGMHVIAVSRDLLDSGLTYRTKVTIDGLKDTFLVLDKMNRRWKNKIDIYMGVSRKDALEWGKREVTIRWTTDNGH